MAETSSNHTQLLNQLMDAMRNRNSAAFMNLCRTHRDAIHASFPEWTTVPKDIRSDKAALDIYANTLIATAQYFAQEHGAPELLERLMAPDEGDHSFKNWMDGLQQAKSLVEQLRYSEARQQLTALIEQASKMYGTAIDDYKPVAYGYLAHCYFHSGQANMAIEPASTALRMCEESGDIEGIHAYLSALYDIHRYLDHKDQAADCAAKLSQVLERAGRHAEAARFAKQARIVRAGEPLNRVVIEIDGEPYELGEQFPLKEGRVAINYVRNRVTLNPSQALCSKGEQLAGTQKFFEALEAFQQAATADPYDPHSRFLEGLTLLHLRRYAEALETYQAVEALAPGWFNCRTDIWMARQLLEGNMSHDLFLDFLQIQDGQMSPDLKAQIMLKALDKHPEMAPLHLYYGENLMAMGRQQDAEAAFRRGLTCSPEPAIECKLLVRLGSMVSSPSERKQFLKRVVQLNGDLYSTAVATITLTRFPA